VSISFCVPLHSSVLVSSVSRALRESIIALCGLWLEIGVSFSFSPAGAALFCPLPDRESGRLVLGPACCVKSLVDLDLLRGSLAGPRWFVSLLVIWVGWYRGWFCICCLGSRQLLLPSWTRLVPSLVWSMAHGAFSGGASFRSRRAFTGPVLQRARATCSRCLALGSYVAVFVALKALLQAALPLKSLALTHLPLPHQSFVDDLVRVLGFSELDDDGRHCFVRWLSS
jgi:hypothetical protein